jgi:hypothetical protein
MDTATAAQTVHDPASTPPLSKSAQKKAAKAAYRASIKLERRARERERRKEKKNKLGAQKRAADDDDDGERKRPRAPPPPFGARVVLDLGFDEMMTDKVRSSPGSALNHPRCYEGRGRKSCRCAHSWRIPTAPTGARRSPSRCFLRRWTDGRAHVWTL